MPSVYSLQKGAKALNQKTLGKVDLLVNNWNRLHPKFLFLQKSYLDIDS